MLTLVASRYRDVSTHRGSLNFENYDSDLLLDPPVKIKMYCLIKLVLDSSYHKYEF